MRFYSIIVTDPAGGQVVTPPGFDGLLGGATYTSYVNGQNLPGAWNVELDIPAVSFDLPMGGGLVRVWGISLAEIGQARDLVGKSIRVFGGMKKGLPLANPAQSGVIAQGYIQQAFGNWIGTEQSLDLIVFPGAGPNGTGTTTAPKNIVLNWKAGMPLSTAVGNALSTAFPGFKQTINISANIVRPNDEVGYFATMTEFAQFIRQASKSIIKTANYAGVRIVPGQNSFDVLDGTTAPPAAKQVAYQDLIGQPTWIEAPSINFKTVMRADLKVGDTIQLPKTIVTNTAAAQSSIVNQRVNFQGKFSITTMRHVGNFREPDAAAWVTVFDAAPVTVN